MAAIGVTGGHVINWLNFDLFSMCQIVFNMIINAPNIQCDNQFDYRNTFSRNVTLTDLFDKFY